MNIKWSHEITQTMSYSQVRPQAYSKCQHSSRPCTALHVMYDSLETEMSNCFTLAARLNLFLECSQATVGLLPLFKRIYNFKLISKVSW